MGILYPFVCAWATSVGFTVSGNTFTRGAEVIDYTEAAKRYQASLK